jgi:hypothetical protein
MKAVDYEQHELRYVVLTEASEKVKSLYFSDLLHGVDKLSWFNYTVLFPHDASQNVPFIHKYCLSVTVKTIREATCV